MNGDRLASANIKIFHIGYVLAITKGGICDSIDATRNAHSEGLWHVYLAAVAQVKI